MASDGLEPQADDPMLALLDPDEAVEAYARAQNHRLVVTERRLVVADDDRALHIKRHRAATLAIVPEHPSDEPQVLSVPPERYDEMALALAYIGRRFDDDLPADATTFTLAKGSRA